MLLRCSQSWLSWPRCCNQALAGHGKSALSDVSDVSNAGNAQSGSAPAPVASKLTSTYVLVGAEQTAMALPLTIDAGGDAAKSTVSAITSNLILGGKAAYPAYLARL